MQLTSEGAIKINLHKTHLRIFDIYCYVERCLGRCKVGKIEKEKDTLAHYGIAPSHEKVSQDFCVYTYCTKRIQRGWRDHDTLS